MDPRLVAISGPREGQTFRLSDDCLTVGRHASNDLQLPSPEVSRHHCELRRDGHRFHIVDLESRHGLQVNGQPTTDQHLQHSDLITLGGSTLLFLLDDSGSSVGQSKDPLPPSGVPEPSLTHKPTALLSMGNPEASDGLPQAARLARDLQTLLGAASELQGPLALEAVCHRLLDAMAETLPAERWAILLDRGDLSLTLIAERRHDSISWTPPGPSQTILRRVLDDGVGWLCDPQRDITASASTETVGALLCAPLLGADGDPSGILYADGRQPGVFDSRHLEMLGALAQLGASALRNAQRLQRLEDENHRLRNQQLDHDMVGDSAAMQKLLGMVAKVARVDSTVLIRGESGTGKELAAQAIHRSSPRKDHPFVAINCATFSDTLFESELFGHEKGAFTGAVERKIGQIEAARGGTLFLDEVGEIPMPLQAKLLRVLQERQFQRVGGSRPITTDVRLVAATNRDLEAAIQNGRFREDLYYRLKVITLETPALRQRRDDISVLAQHFVDLHGRHIGRPGVQLSAKARRCLTSYAWPGNVRELGNVIERALVLGEGEAIQPEDLPDEVVGGAAWDPAESAEGMDFQRAVARFKKELVIDAYRQAGEDYSGAAEILGVHVNSLHRMISRLGIKDQLRHPDG